MVVATLGQQYNIGEKLTVILYTYIDRHAGPPNKKSKRQCSACVCVFSSHPLWTSSSLDVPAGVTQDEGHTGFFIHLPSAVRILIFLARRIQPFLSLVDREVDNLCTNDFVVLHSLGIFYLFFSEKNPVYGDRTHVPTCQKVTRLPLSYRGDRLVVHKKRVVIIYDTSLVPSNHTPIIGAWVNSKMSGTDPPLYCIIT